MKYDVATEAALMERILTFRDLPLDFARFAYPWGEAGTPFAKWDDLFPWQAGELGALQDHCLALADVREQGLEPANETYRSATSSGRGPGKSALLAIIADWNASTHFGASTVVAANSENQLRNRVFPEFALWFGASINAHWWNIEGIRITPQAWLVETLARTPAEGGIGLDPKYWSVTGQMWSEENPSGFAGGRSSHGTAVLFDEAAGIPEGVWTVTDGFFASAMAYKIWIAMSQMRDNKGAFFDRFNHAQKKLGWRTRAMNVQGMQGVDQAWVRGMIDAYGEDSDQVRVEVMGLAPRTSEDQFIPAESVRLAMGNVLVPDLGEGLVMAVDPAPRGRTAIRFRQGRNARNCVGSDTALVLEGSDNLQIAEEVVRLDHKYRPQYVVIDFGMGTGVIDVLKRRHLNARMVEIKFGDMALDKKGEFGSRGAELWGLLRDWLPGGMIPQDDGTEKTLSGQMLNRGWKWSGREDGKKVMEDKAAMKARGVSSPDDADALALTLAVNPPRRDRTPYGGGVQIADGVGKLMGEG